MSTCISRQGEYGDHELTNDREPFTCQRCFVFDEASATAEIHRLRSQLGGGPMTEPERRRLGVLAAQAIKSNLPVDAFGDPRRLNDYADIWGAAARTAVLAGLIEIEEARRG